MCVPVHLLVSAGLLDEHADLVIELGQRIYERDVTMWLGES